MMVPKVEARLVQELALTPTDRVLEVGTGSGYLTALMARLAGHVYSVEIVDALSRSAARTLEAEGVTNVTLKVGNGARGWDEHAPYDAIAVTGSMPELEPDLARSLTLGGRLVAVVGEAPIMEAILVVRESEEGWSRTSLFDTELPPLRGLPERQLFEF
jgi:protein-L-isoaspartate(D-aspartate) O-methyltransferase